MKVTKQNARTPPTAQDNALQKLAEKVKQFIHVRTDMAL